MALFNTDGEYVRGNRALCAMLGRPAGDLIGRRDQDLTHPEDRDADVCAAWEILDGRRDSHQAEKRWVGQFQDVTERRRQEAELRHLADHDPLTGCSTAARSRWRSSSTSQRVRRAGGDVFETCDRLHPVRVMPWRACGRTVAT